MDRTARVAVGSIVVSLVVVGLKAAAWRFTHSAALFSDAAESVVNVAAAAMALAAIRFSAQPPDENHPYGHAKGELFAAVVEGGLIAAAAVLILQHAWLTWRAPHPIAAPWRGIAVNLIATACNAAWAAVLRRTGRRSVSPALLAEARHLGTDVITSLSLAAGLTLAVATGVVRLDPALGAATACYILWSGYRLIRNSVGGLMDEAPAPDVVERITGLVAEHASGALQAHDIRTRAAGRTTFLQFHLVVPGEMSVADAHGICDRIEAGISADMPMVVTTIHVEPEIKAKDSGAVVL